MDKGDKTMKARIKATGDIVDVTRIVDRYVMTHHPQTITFEKDELDFDIEDEPDYWTRLEHTYVGMFMKSFLDNFDGTTSMGILADDAIKLAHALVEKLKEKEERK